MPLNWEALEYLGLPVTEYAVIGPAVMEAYGWLPAQDTEIIVTDRLYYDLASRAQSRFETYATDAECLVLNTPHGQVTVTYSATHKPTATFPGTKTVLASSSLINGIPITHPGLIRAWQGAPNTPPAESFITRKTR
jgi:hypothetical protein